MIGPSGVVAPDCELSTVLTDNMGAEMGAVPSGDGTFGACNDRPDAKPTLLGLPDNGLLDIGLLDAPEDPSEAGLRSRGEMAIGDETGIGGKSVLELAALDDGPASLSPFITPPPFSASFRLFSAASFRCCSSCSRRERRIASMTIN